MVLKGSLGDNLVNTIFWFK